MSNMPVRSRILRDLAGSLALFFLEKNEKKQPSP